MTFILVYLRKPLKIKKFVSYYIFSMILKQLTARYIVDVKDEVPPIGRTSNMALQSLSQNISVQYKLLEKNMEQGQRYRYSR